MSNSQTVIVMDDGVQGDQWHRGRGRGRGRWRGNRRVVYHGDREDMTGDAFGRRENFDNPNESYKDQRTGHDRHHWNRGRF